MPVATLLTDAKRYADGLVTKAESALGEAISAVAWAGAPFIGATFANLPATPQQGLTLQPPTLAAITLDLPPAPANTLTFQDITAVDAGGAPALTAVVPTLTLPTAPAQVAPFLAAAPGINTSIVFPEPPSALINPLIVAPVLPDRLLRRLKYCDLSQSCIRCG